MNDEFYSELLQLILWGDEDQARELLGKLSLDQLQDLARAGSMLSQMCRVIAMDKDDGDENEPT